MLTLKKLSLKTEFQLSSKHWCYGEHRKNGFRGPQDSAGMGVKVCGKR